MSRHFGVSNPAVLAVSQASNLVRPVSAEPIPADPSFSNVSLLLKADGANNSTTFVDSSANNFAISRFGNTRIDSFSPHNKEDGKWSIYFPSQADSIRKNYLLVGGTTSSGNITTNWTFETWFRGSSVSERGVIAAKSDLNTDTGNSWTARVDESGATPGKFSFMVYHGTGWPVNFKKFISVSRVDDGNWHHLAFVKQGTTYRIFVDGVLELQEVFNTPLNNGTAESITIGGATPNPNGGDYGRTDCHLSNLRISTTAVYTSAFSPPVTPLESAAGTFLLTCQGRTFKDNGPNNHSITLGRGSPQISDVSPLANVTTPITGSAYFDGTGDYLAVAANNAFDFGTGDFCVESWVYLTADRTSYQMVASIAWGSGQGLQLRYGDNGFGRKLQVNVRGDTAASVWSTAATQAAHRNTWVHLAFTRSSGVCRLFVNGVVQNVNNGVNPGTYPFTSFTDTSNVTGNTVFHAGTGSGTATLLGYLDDLRVTKGVARYTANFTPPGPHPTSGA